VNLILLFDDDFVAPGRVVLRGRRFDHARDVLKAAAGRPLTVGLAGGNRGRGIVTATGDETIEMTVELDEAPPDPLPLTLVAALPRPKVVNRLVVAATSLGIKRIWFVNAWRVEKSYWESPRLDPGNLRLQSIVGLEQSRDTILPAIELRRFLRPFVEQELPAIAGSARRIVAHPAGAPLPNGEGGETVVAIGPEGGWIDREIDLFARAGFTAVSLGERPLRVESVVPFVAGRLFG
jgi:16S rRNA (uracil1498-N3)-methyltransferase